MSFNSSDFLIFFPIVVLIYFLIPQKLKNYWLLIASYYFYMCWNAKYALIILFSTIVTYLSGLALDTLQQRSADPLITRKKKIVVAISVLLNLSLLFYFKYINFCFTISTFFQKVTYCDFFRYNHSFSINNFIWNDFITNIYFDI